MIKNNALIPISILTGFLGSGKTTLLNQLLSSSELSDSAVLINEFGEIGVDHLLVDVLDEEIMLLESGCVCCSVRDDFSASLLVLHDKLENQAIPPFRRVILETTGIADPIAIQELILSERDITQRFHCKDILTVVDAVYGTANLDKYVEAVKQINVADRIVISKTDLCEQAQIEALEERLHHLNPLAPILYSGAEPIDPKELLHSHNKIRQRFDGAQSSTNAVNKGAAHDHRFTTFTLSWSEAITQEDFAAWLETLLIVRGNSIHRLKGLLRIEGETKPTVIQGVQHSFYPPTTLDKWPDDTIKTELVFITCDFSKQAAINSLAHVLNVSPA